MTFFIFNKCLVLINFLNSSITDGEREEPEVQDDPDWVDGDRPAPQVDFTGNPGLRAQLPDNPSVLDFFFLLVSVDIIAMMVEETNRYAQQYFARNVLRPVYVSGWTFLLLR